MRIQALYDLIRDLGLLAVPLYFLRENGMYFSSLVACDGEQFALIHKEQVFMSVSDSKRGRYSCNFVPDHPRVEFVPKAFRYLLGFKEVFVNRPEEKNAVIGCERYRLP